MPFRIEGFDATEEVVGGNRIQKVREFHVYATPSETYFQFRRAKGTPGYTDPKPAAAQLADRIEAVLALPDVTDVVYFQDTTQGGTLQDRMRTFYSAADGAIRGDVESDLAHFGPNFTGGQVAAEVAQGGDLLGS